MMAPSDQPLGECECEQSTSLAPVAGGQLSSAQLAQPARWRRIGCLLRTEDLIVLVFFSIPYLIHLLLRNKYLNE